MPQGSEPAIRQDAPLGSGEIAVALVLRNRVAVLRWVAALAIAAAAAALVAPSDYVSTASVSAQGGGVAQSLGGLAAQIGFALPASEVALSPQFYADLARSRTVLGQTATTTYASPGKRPVSLAARIGLATGDSALDRDAAIRWLRSAVTASTDIKTGLIGVSVHAPDPVLARDVALQILQGMDSFNARRRQLKGTAEREFMEKRLLVARGELRKAEDILAAFVSRNRDVTNAPTIVLEIERHQRDVLMRREVVTSLLTAFEQARIEEVRDTPSLTVVDLPEVPVRREPRGTLKWFLVGAVVGGVIGLLVSILPLFSHRGQNAFVPGRSELEALVMDFSREVRRPWRLLPLMFRR
jgi:uncharacterized protein involved in exopolysaccharide biosynthesis